ncbi:MAG: ligase-associated DNA damage response endonuclease PdeM [Chloroflexales bacterium]|nr:ligase-associated DNA damage response endonuclease PdeM [Chloroflexales bacterium]
MPDLTIELAGETVALLPERALFWPRRATLFVADAHWGKAASFRAAAIALPGGTTSDDLARLDRLLARTGAQRLVLLGDLFHARAAKATRTLDAIAAWRSRNAQLEIALVRGNHDRSAGDPPAALAITSHNEPLDDPPFALRHFPRESAGGYTLAGHLHPGVVLAGAGRQRLRLPCFHLGPHMGVLPAFGSFTGSATMRRGDHDRVFVIADDEILAMND